MGKMNFRNRGEPVYETLRQEILSLGPKPSQMVSGNDICERFGVPRTPVRDALRLLQEQGFAETIPYRGTYVTLLSLDNIKQIVYMRVAVKTMVLRDSLEIQTPIAMEDIHYSIAQRRTVIRKPGFEPKQLCRTNTQIYSTWFAAVRRQKLQEILQTQQLHYTRFRMLDFIMETGFIRTIGEYRDLFRLIADRNEKGLEKALEERLYYGVERMRRSVEVDYKDYSGEEDEEGRSAT